MKNALQSKKLRDRKRRKKLFIGTFLSFIPIVFISLIARLSYIDYFQINNISISGNTVLSEKEIEIYINQKIHEPLLYFFSQATALTYPKKEIKDYIASKGLIVKDYKVTVDSFKTIEVQIKERDAVARLCNDKSCFLLDQEGLAYMQDDIEYKNVINFSSKYLESFVLGSTLAKKEYFSEFISFINMINDLGFQSHKIDISKQNDLLVNTGTTSPMFFLAFGQDMNKLEERLNALMKDQVFKDKILKNRIDYIDLRFGNKIYYKEKTVSP